ncbi:hypothetical protein ACTFIZ_002313, partial [Dictyostelium cf. discoideum]
FKQFQSKSVCMIQKKN